MSDRISIPLKRFWFENPEDERRLMNMLHCIICGQPPRGFDNAVPFKKDNGNWQIDSSNDWFAWLEDGKLFVMYRYSGDRVKALGAWLEKFFG